MFSTRKHIIINLSSPTYRFDRGCWHYFTFLSLSIPFSCLVFAILNLWYSSWLNFISSIEESQPSQSSHLVATFWLDWMAQLLGRLKHFSTRLKRASNFYILAASLSFIQRLAAILSTKFQRAPSFILVQKQSSVTELGKSETFYCACSFSVLFLLFYELLLLIASKN